MLALTDMDNLCGAPRFPRAMQAAGLRPLVGAEVTIDGEPLLLLCRDATGYGHLCRLLTHAAAGGASFQHLTEHSVGLMCLLLALRGPLRGPLAHGDQEAAAALERMLELFDPGDVCAELQLHGEEAEDLGNGALLSLARRYELPLVATNDVRFAAPDRALLCDALACVRGGTTLERAGAALLRRRPMSRTLLAKTSR